ncbi:FecR domain-containing protein [Sphingomonas sp. KR1UV-12]|uniref:FecR domain-containing protein n=1 Tax=Sphingomonas aurea TaxID=3063994 RepID=A0ABT9EKW3_9SPHN|nr:FecR domain-containing protein [Sphingomonas sp. KR1UV-12]MDP1027584.1 FecR domain-containing protein [Sphingomonas sp. KR1UV-12]
MPTADALSPLDADALDWVRRVHDPEFADWDAHLAWLEEDAAHADAFDRMQLLVDAATADLAPSPAPEPVFANDNAPDPQRGWTRRWWLGGGVAVAATALAVLTTTLGGGPVEQIVQTASGEQRTVALADGTTIAMNGGTSIRFAGPAAREVAVERGEAFFTVHHDTDHPFVVRIGDDAVRDIGTAFNVARSNTDLRVAVREGEVVYDAGRSQVRLPAGRRLTAYKGTAAVSSVDPAAVGGWRSGRLVYRDATLAEVAADLSRAIGEPVVASPDSDLTRFTGVILVKGDRRRMFDRVEAVTGARATHDATGWRLAVPAR